MTHSALASQLEFLARRLRNGCGNGDCIVKRPEGMRTNGACNCAPRNYSSQLLGLSLECESMGLVWDRDSKPEWREIGMRKRQEREGRGETIRDYARRIGLDSKRVSDMELGYENPEGLR